MSASTTGLCRGQTMSPKELRVKRVNAGVTMRTSKSSIAESLNSKPERRRSRAWWKEHQMVTTQIRTAERTPTYCTKRTRHTGECR